jgi:L-Ala-D/L-Glu epimerase
MRRKLEAHAESWQLARPFATATTVQTKADFIVVTLTDDHLVGQGEAAGVHYHGETTATMLAQVASVRAAIEDGAKRQDLLSLLPPGGARNAIDCALWSLEARAAGTSVAALLGVAPVPFRTVCTIGIDTPEAMAVEAARLSAFPALKVKLDAANPLARIAAVRAARPDAALIVDANTGWTPADLSRLAPALAAVGVRMIEQPCPPAQDQELAGYSGPVPLCADESCQTAADLAALPESYRLVCIKLDKTGGLTAALDLAKAARVRGLGIMLGNMIGTTLAMAPLSMLAGDADWIDLDGPLLLARDRPPGMTINDGMVQPFPPDAWG